MRLSDRDLWARTHPEPKAGADWCRIEAKKKDDKSDKTVTVVHIYDEIGYWGTNANDFVKQIMAIDSDIIQLHINSPGGSVFDGVAIYSSLKQHAAEIHVIVDSLAASAASFIAQAGDTITMQRNATMMIHDASAVCYGNEQEMLDTANVLGKISNNIADIYAQSAGGTVEEWRAIMREEAWYSSQEAVDAGLATEVADSENKDAEKAQNSWDFSVYKNKGRDNAPPPAKVKELALNNLRKETAVSGATGTKASETTPETPAETQPPAQPETPPTPPAEEEKPAEGEQTPAAPEGGEPAAKVTMTAQGQPIFMINGSPVTDFSQVQAHIKGLETFRDDSLTAARKAFVKSLADDGKILASQMGAQEAFALTLTDAQYDQWKSSFDAVPKQSLLSEHGQGSGTGTTGTQAIKTEDEKATLEETIAHLKRSGLSDEAIKNTNAFKRLQALTTAPSS